MDFFERQEKARRSTKLLEVYFALAIAGIIITTYLAVTMMYSAYALRHHYFAADEPLLWHPRLLVGVAVGTLVVIFCGSGYKTAQLAGGGSVVAEMLGGRPINANTSDPNEQKLLHVVEEMAIASGTPVPHVYVLDSESGINAFAAGHSTGDMVVCATRGAIRALSRDELQGVIGHEFSHILNGDMKLNLRLMGLVFGILCIAVFGRILLYTRGGDRDRNSLPLLGIALLVIGSIGVFFGKLIKSAVSRQREFLADASSVQFTRNPEGLANALKKVGSCGSRLQDPNAEDASHLFFANGLTESFLGMFSTHPPLEERIRLLDPAWDGKFIPVDADLVEDRPVPTVQNQTGRSGTNILPPRLTDLLGQPAAAIAMGGGLRSPLGMAAVGMPTPQHLDYAADLRSKLPPALAAAAREPIGALALIYALLLSPDEKLRGSQLEQLQKKVDAPIWQETVKLAAQTAGLESRARLPLVNLAMTALRQLSPSQFAQFGAALDYLIKSDQKLELFEYTLQKIVRRQLESYYGQPRRHVVQYYVLKPLVPDCAVLLSALAYAGQEEAGAITAAFQQGAAQLNAPGLALLDPAACGFDQIDAALGHLNQAAPPIKKQALYACAATVAADGVIQEAEAELLRAIADTLDCPIPPFLSLG